MVGMGIILAMLSGIQTEAAGVTCHFPGETPDQKPILVQINEKPSLQDRPGFVHVDMALNNRIVFEAAASPIADTEEKDVLVLGKSIHHDIYSLGFREDGAAAFSIRLAGKNGYLNQGITRTGECHGVAPFLRKWLAS